MNSTRNMPCRCGSGKKTKHCCGVEIVAPVSSAPHVDPFDIPGPTISMIPFRVSDKRAVAKAIAGASQQLVRVDAEESGGEPGWDWMAHAGDANPSAEVVLVDGCLMISAYSEANAEACRQFIASIVGSAATSDGSFHQN